MTSTYPAVACAGISYDHDRSSITQNGRTPCKLDVMSSPQVPMPQRTGSQHPGHRLYRGRSRRLVRHAHSDRPDRVGPEPPVAPIPARLRTDSRLTALALTLLGALLLLAVALLAMWAPLAPVARGHRPRGAAVLGPVRAAQLNFPLRPEPLRPAGRAVHQLLYRLCAHRARRRTGGRRTRRNAGPTHPRLTLTRRQPARWWM